MRKAVKRADQGDKRIKLGLGWLDVRGLHNDADRRHRKQIRHDVGNNSQVDQPIELIKEFRANGHKAEARLDGDNDDHAENRRTPAINFRKAFREETFCGGLLEHFGDRELPAKRGTRAGKNQEEGHELSDGGIEHSD